MERERIQESLYSFPYHHLPNQDGGVWQVGRFLGSGYQYLAVMHSVLALVEHARSDARHPERILDFGCGDGRVIMELLCRYRDLETLIGIDVSEKALAFARAWTWGEGCVKFFSNLGELPQDCLPFDTVIAMEVFEHVQPDDLSVLLHSLHDVLHPGGILVVSVPTTNLPVNPKHYQHFTVDSLLAVTGKFFQLEEVRYVHRLGLVAAIIKRAAINRLFVTNNRVWLKIATALYNRLVRDATPETGAHLACRFRRRGP